MFSNHEKNLLIRNDPFLPLCSSCFNFSQVMRPRISLTFISLTCLVGMMMLVTISRYGSDPVGEMAPIGIRGHQHVPQRSPIESWIKSNHFRSNSIKYKVSNSEENEISNVIPNIYGIKSSPFQKLKAGNAKKWFIPGGSSSSFEYKSDGSNDGAFGQGNQFIPVSSTSSSSFSSPSTAIPSSSSTPINSNSIESTKKPAIISSTSSTGLRSELDFPEGNNPQLQLSGSDIQKTMNNIQSSLVPNGGNNPSLSQSPSPGPIYQSSTTLTGRVSVATPIKAKPKITFDWEDLETTNKFVINKLNFCDEDNGATTDMMVIVASAVTHFEARDAIRRTWGGFAIERGAKLLFLLGSPSPQDDGSIQDQINQEDNKFGDILQGSFIDDYYNLTLKSISMLQWVNETCDAVKYVLKIDDDMFVNMQMMVDFSETRTFSKVVIGKLARKWRPHHDPKSKWYVPQSAFNGTIFPNFATGPAYIFTGDATKYLLETALSSTPIYLEDVYVTGIVAEKAGVRRLNHALMKNVRLKVDACTFKRFITSHQHSPKEIVHLWKVVYEPPTRNCTVVKSSVTQSAAQIAAAQLRQRQQQQQQPPPLPPTDVRSPSQQQPRQVQSAPSLTIQLPSSSKLNLNSLMKGVPPTSFQPQFPIILNQVPPVKVVQS